MRVSNVLYIYIFFNILKIFLIIANYLLVIIIVPEKPLWGGSIKYVCMYILTCP